MKQFGCNFMLLHTVLSLLSIAPSIALSELNGSNQLDSIKTSSLIETESFLTRNDVSSNNDNKAVQNDGKRQDIEPANNTTQTKSSIEGTPVKSMNLHQDMILQNETKDNHKTITSQYVGAEITVNLASPSKAETFINNYTALANFKGDISDSFLHRINPHWLSFPPTSAGAHYTLAFIYFIMMVVGMSGNFLVIFLYIKCANIRTPANNFILNLACADFLIMLEAPIFIYNSLHMGPASGELACSLYGLMGGMGGSVAIMTLCAISVDRYNVIVFPLNPSRSTTNLRSRLMILFVWIYALPFALVPFLEMYGSSYIPEGYLTACSFDYLNTSSNNKTFIMIYAFFAYVVPISVITYCYIHIMHIVMSAQKIQSSKDKSKSETKLAFVVMGIIGLWLFAWTPYAIVAVLGVNGMGDYISPTGSMIPAILAKVAACVDPYLYAVTHPRFRAEIEKMFCTKANTQNGNFQTSYYSRGTSKRQDRVDSDCETVVLGNDDKSPKPKPPLKRADSEISRCDESEISVSIECVHEGSHERY